MNIARHLRPRSITLLLLAWIGFEGTLPAETKEAAPASPEVTCEVRYHFREKLEGIKAGGKRFSAPADERESLPASHLVVSNGRQTRVVEGIVPNLPYRFAIRWTESDGKETGTLDVNVVDATGKPLRGYPQSLENPFAKPAEPGSKVFEIPVSKELAQRIEKRLLARNQLLTHVDLVIQPRP